MPDEALHAKLCSICYENESKYRCPRCQVKTCSLPCTQKHKQRADCNGIRNPAAYLKRSQLATPAGIDRDYNYLKGVERSIDIADREREARGVDVVEKGATKSLNRARHPDSILRKYIVENRIDVRSAPNGMSRQKINKTRHTKRHLLLWTVEWVDADGAKYISDSCQEGSTIVELYALKQTEQINAMKRKPGEHRTEAQKRRRIERQMNSKEESAPAVATTTSRALKDLEHAAASTSEATEVTKDEPSAGKKDETSPDLTQPALDQHDKTPNVPEVEGDVDPSLHFYLLKPSTSSKEKVLIALDKKATLTNSLRDRTVLEFPTIFVLPYDSTSLPAGYMLEEQYLQLQRKDKEELKEAVARAEKKGVFEHVRNDKASSKSGASVDANSILKSLRRDMTR